VPRELFPFLQPGGAPITEVGLRPLLFLYITLPNVRVKRHGRDSFTSPHSRKLEEKSPRPEEEGSFLGKRGNGSFLISELSGPGRCERNQVQPIHATQWGGPLGAGRRKKSRGAGDGSEKKGRFHVSREPFVRVAGNVKGKKAPESQLVGDVLYARKIGP